MQVDYLIVGQGLAGTLVSYNLIQNGKKVAVFDVFQENSSSRVAAGLYNPITGPRSLKTWLADDLFPFLEPYYKKIEDFLEIKFLHKKSIFRPFDTIAEQNNWYGQSADPELKNYVEVNAAPFEIQKHYKAPFGGIETKISGFVDLKTMIDSFAIYLVNNQYFNRTKFQYEELVFTENLVSYRGISAKAIIFCEGQLGRQNPFFNYLPLNGTKGQVLDVEIENYAIDSVVSKGVFILPGEMKQRVGSNYEWEFEHDLPTEKATLEITQKLSLVLHSPYKILSQLAGIRPTTKDRRPLLGKHSDIHNAYIFNGLGTKGVSVAPYFSNMFVDWLLGEGELLKEVDILRFNK
jgi:glycine oxidase